MLRTWPSQSRMMPTRRARPTIQGRIDFADILEETRLTSSSHYMSDFDHTENLRRERRVETNAAHLFTRACHTGDVDAFYEAINLIDRVGAGCQRCARSPGMSEPSALKSNRRFRVNGSSARCCLSSWATIGHYAMPRACCCPSIPGHLFVCFAAPVPPSAAAAFTGCPGRRMLNAPSGLHSAAG